MNSIRFCRKVISMLMVTCVAIGLSNCTDKVQKPATKTIRPQTQIVKKIKPPSVPVKIVPRPAEDTIIVIAAAKTVTKQAVKPAKSKSLAVRKEVPTVKDSIRTLRADYSIYANLKNILNLIAIGETVTKEQLITSKAVPEDALKVVKSIRKVSDNELEIKWKSKWILEKISDVKLKDDHVKLKFSKNLVYTSGNAIGIKYEDKVYTNLIIKGNRAYIPSVKEYSWRIGK